MVCLYSYLMMTSLIESDSPKNKSLICSGKRLVLYCFHIYFHQLSCLYILFSVSLESTSQFYCSISLCTRAAWASLSRFVVQSCQLMNQTVLWLYPNLGQRVKNKWHAVCEWISCWFMCITHWVTGSFSSEEQVFINSVE